MGPVSGRVNRLNTLWAMARQTIDQPHPMPSAIKPDASRSLTSQTGVYGSRNLSASASTSSLLITDRIGKPAARALSGAESIPVYATTGLQQTIYGYSEDDALSGRILHQAQDDTMRAFHFGEVVPIAETVSMQKQTTRMLAESAIQAECYRASQTIIDNMGNDIIFRNARGEVIAIWKYNLEDGTYRVQTYR